MSGVLTTLDGGVLTVTIDRAGKRNAMTVEMYEQLVAAVERAEADPQVRALVLRSASEEAFIAGTDIPHFRGFDGAAGVDYEAMITAAVDRLESVPVPTVAVVDGACLGGGLVLASVCDVRIATPRARFGAPIARTLGNCLSANSLSVLTARLGSSVTLDLLLRARTLDGEQAARLGYVAELVDPADLDATVAATVETLLSHSPLTMWATKEVVARLRRAGLPDDSDVVQKVYGSQDFQVAIESFLSRTPMTWTGQ